MPRYQYCGVPATPPPLTLSTISGNVSARAGTKYFALQYRNRAGYSMPSPVQAIAVNAGQGVRIVIPSSARPSPTGFEYGVDIKEFVILMGESAVLADMVIVATFPNNQVNGSVYPLPAQIDLTEDDHLNVTNLNVAALSALPPIPVHGMRRSVTTPSSFLAYDAVFTPIGWKPAFPQQFGSYVPNTTSTNGCDRDIGDIADTTVILAPAYACDGNPSDGVLFWIANDGTVNISSETRVGLALSMGGVDVSSLFVGLLQISFLGYSNMTTGTLDVTGMTVGGTVPYQGLDTSIVLQKDLPPGYAFLMRVYGDFSAASLNNRVPQGATIKISPYLYPDFAVFSPIGNILGTFISSEYSLRRILPSGPGNTAKALKGAGMIQSANGGGYEFKVGESSVLGLAANTANQQVLLSINGAVYASNTVLEGTAIRAFVGTLDGYGKPTAWAGSVALDNTKVLEVALTHPTAIRADYPDLIAGNSAAVFNATRVRVYVRPVGGGTILQFQSLITPGQSSQTFVFGASAGTNIGTSLPANPANNFGLFSPGASVLNTQNIASVFSAGTYEVAIAYIWENTVTSISHDPLLGCILEIDTTLAESLSRGKYYGQPLPNAAAFRALSSLVIPDTQERKHAGRKVPYMYQANSFGTDDGTETSKYYKPNNLTALQPGRWVRVMRVDVGTVSVSPDETASVTTREDGGGTTLFDFSIPTVPGPKGLRGLRGPAGRIAIASVEEVGPGEATIVNIGTASDARLVFRIPVGRGPRGRKGDRGQAGAAGTLTNNSGVIFTNSSAPSAGLGQSGLFSSGDRLFFASSGGLGTSELALLRFPQSYTAGKAIAPVTITPGSPTDASLSNNFYMTLTANSVLQNPINPLNGQAIVWRFIQTDSFTLGFGSKFRFPGGVVPSVSMGANKVDRLSCIYDSVRDLWDCTYINDYA